MKQILALALMIVLTTVGAYCGTPQVVAHRGHWTAAGSAQNSIRSLQLADSIGCDATEFDVWMTVDGVLIVYHDNDVDSMRIEDTPYGMLREHRLQNGEHIPLLEQYLAEATRLQVPLVLELKPHKDKNREALAVKVIVGMIEAYGLTDRTSYISFSKDAVINFISEALRGTEVYYLNGEMTPEELSAIKAAGPDYHFSRFRKNPEWIEQAHSLGQKVNVWTVNDEETMRRAIEQGVDFITTNHPEQLQLILKEYKQ